MSSASEHGHVAMRTRVQDWTYVRMDRSPTQSPLAIWKHWALREATVGVH